MESQGPGQLLTAVPFAFSTKDEAEAKFLGSVFNSVYGHLAIERAGDTRLEPQALPENSDPALMRLGKKLTSAYVLGARVRNSGTENMLLVRLIKTEDATLAWSGQYLINEGDPTTIADQIAIGVLDALPEKMPVASESAQSPE